MPERLRRALGPAAAVTWLLVIALARADVPAPGRLLAPVNEWLTALVQVCLHVVGVEATRHGALLYVPGAFAYEIVIGCSGLLPAGVVAVAILSSPATSAAQAWGVLAAVAAMLTLNVVRLAHLFYVGVHAPQRFPLAHGLVWEAVLVVAAFAVWWAWGSGFRARGPGSATEPRTPSPEPLQGVR